jgi:hypothetical protein
MAGLTNSPITIGTASASTIHAADLGKIIFVDGKGYRLVRANAAIAAAANKVLVRTAGTDGTWTVDATASANSVLIAGVVPAGQTGSTGTTGLVSGDYFFIQVSGTATPIVVTGSVAAGTGLTTSTTSGSADAATGTYGATVPGQVFATLQVASSAGAASAAKLVNLL